MKIDFSNISLDWLESCVKVSYKNEFLGFIHNVSNIDDIDDFDYSILEEHIALLLEQKKQADFNKRYNDYIKYRIADGGKPMTRTQNEWVRFFLQEESVTEIQKIGDIDNIFKHIVKFLK